MDTVTLDPTDGSLITITEVETIYFDKNGKPHSTDMRIYIVNKNSTSSNYKYMGLSPTTLGSLAKRKRHLDTMYHKLFVSEDEAVILKL